MKILVTGATGFVGRNLVKFLDHKGHQVYSLVRTPAKFALLHLPGKIIVGDLQTRTPNTWANQLPADLDVVIHLAGTDHAQNYREFYKTNTRKSIRFFNDLKNRYPNLRFIYLSSIEALGPALSSDGVDDKTKPHPVGHYGHSKFQTEVALVEEMPTSWTKLIIRAPLVIGEDCNFIKMLTKMIHKGKVYVPGHKALNIKLSYIDIEDLVNIINRSIYFNPKNESVNYFLPSYPIAITFEDLIRKIQSAVGQNDVHIVEMPFFVMEIITRLVRLIKRYHRSTDWIYCNDALKFYKHEFWTINTNLVKNKLYYIPQIAFRLTKK